MIVYYTQITPYETIHDIRRKKKTRSYARWIWISLRDSVTELIRAIACSEYSIACPEYSIACPGRCFQTWKYDLFGAYMPERWQQYNGCDSMFRRFRLPKFPSIGHRTGAQRILDAWRAWLCANLFVSKLTWAMPLLLLSHDAWLCLHEPTSYKRRQTTKDETDTVLLPMITSGSVYVLVITQAKVNSYNLEVFLRWFSSTSLT